jgi:hypothetical protein
MSSLRNVDAGISSQERLRLVTQVQEEVQQIDEFTSMLEFSLNTGGTDAVLPDMPKHQSNPSQPSPQELQSHLSARKIALSQDLLELERYSHNA